MDPPHHHKFFDGANKAKNENENDDDALDDLEDDGQWVHTSCALSLPSLECWFVDRNAQWNASPCVAVMGVGTTHSDSEGEGGHSEEEAEEEDDDDSCPSDGDVRSDDGRKQKKNRDAKRKKKRGRAKSSSSFKYGVNWADRRALKCEVCGKTGAPAQCAYADCVK